MRQLPHPNLVSRASRDPVTMLDMSKRNGAASPREGTAAAVRAAAESGAMPSPATAERPASTAQVRISGFTRYFGLRPARYSSIASTIIRL